MLTFLDFFSGTGGFRLGMEYAGHKCLGHCEIDKYANISYNALHHPSEGEWFCNDIRKTDETTIPKADVWCAGFPCQDISIAGNQRGFQGERSSLFFTVTNLIRRIQKEDRPKLLFFENVKNLLSINGGWDFAKLLIELDDIGYDSEWELLNTKDFGLPQNRERVFIIGHLRGECGQKVFPIRRSSTKNSPRQLIGGSQGMRIYDCSGTSVCLSANGGGQGAKTGLYTVKACLTPDRINKRQNGRRFKNEGEPSFTLTAQDRHGILLEDLKTGKNFIRKLTPLECFRLQGYTDEQFEVLRNLHSDAQLYKQAGNGVSIPVIYEIASRFEENISEEEIQEDLSSLI